MALNNPHSNLWPRKLYLLFPIALATLASCSKPMKDPELLDPIYLDLKAQTKSYESQIKETEASISELKTELEKSEPQSSNPKRITKKIYQAQETKVRLEQMLKYTQIRIQNRKEYSRKLYLSRYKRNLPWPDPDVNMAYQTHKRLLASPKKWDARVPKLRQGAVAPTSTPKEQPSKAASGASH